MGKDRTDGTNVTRQAVTRHLGVLAGAGIVRGQRRGRECLLQLEPRRLSQARQYFDQISTGWDAALGRLRRSVEG